MLVGQKQQEFVWGNIHLLHCLLWENLSLTITQFLDENLTFDQVPTNVMPVKIAIEQPLLNLHVTNTIVKPIRGTTTQVKG